MNVPTMADMMAQGKQPEVLFWVGAAGSYDDRAKKISRAFVKNIACSKCRFCSLRNRRIIYRGCSKKSWK